MGLWAPIVLSLWSAILGSAEPSAAHKLERRMESPSNHRGPRESLVCSRRVAEKRASEFGVESELARVFQAAPVCSRTPRWGVASTWRRASRICGSCRRARERASSKLVFFSRRRASSRRARAGGRREGGATNHSSVHFALTVAGAASG